ncbi:MAG: hypothetical protein NZ693_08675, partial [Thermoflexales bacterium]|nr:hypothetical protein [Thermoflexales bacterium]
MYESKLSLEEVLEQVKQRLLESPLMFYRDEATVRQFLVEPVLRALGWNFEDGSVRSEYSLKYAR